MRTKLACSLILQILAPTWPARSAPSEPQHKFTVRDDIELARFGDIAVSPDETMVVVQTERASLQDGMMHETLRLYNLKTVRAAMNAPDQSKPIRPVWLFERAVKDSGGNSDRISRIKWLANGSGFAFSVQTDQYHHRLYLANIGSQRVITLSPAGEDVLGFDIRDFSHYVFTVASHEAEAKLKLAFEAPFRAGTGHYLSELAFPELYSHIIQHGDLWAAAGGPPAPVMDHVTGAPISLFSDENQFLALSPDGKTLVAIHPVEDVPKDWETRFPPPFPNSAYRLTAHRQDLAAPSDGWSYVGEWVRISLPDGSMTSLTDAPASDHAGWWETYASPAWSDDGSSVLLPGTFDKNSTGADLRPCISVVRIVSGVTECVRPLKRNLASSFEAGYTHINDVSFLHGEDNRVVLKGFSYDKDVRTTSIYARARGGAWQLEEAKSVAGSGTHLEVNVNETFKNPPVLVVADPVSGKSKEILDPNPQLKTITFGEPELYTWPGKSGQKWRGILYKPIGYSPNVKYPLVIQNHGFSEDMYLPSGGIPNAFVAQELASAGIMVLHVRDCDGRSTPGEGPCNVDEYESAVEQLSNEGLIDSSRVGIIGFSRTVYYVLEALTNSKIHFRAASITDGVSYGYMNYLQTVDQSGVFHHEEMEMIGAEPFGSGMAQWLRFSPVFNLDRVTTPLRVVAPRSDGVLEMWEPYALLEEMHKPVDLIILNTREHVLADPEMRLITQGGNVDWFRFWLQDYEDPDPSKQEQYARWRKLRDLAGSTRAAGRQ